MPSAPPPTTDVEADRYVREPDLSDLTGYLPHLARREIGVMFRELLTRVPNIHATAPPSRLNSSFINGIKRLPVDFTPSTGGNR